MGFEYGGQHSSPAFVAVPLDVCGIFRLFQSDRIIFAPVTTGIASSVRGGAHAPHHVQIRRRPFRFRQFGRIYALHVGGSPRCHTLSELRSMSLAMSIGGHRLDSCLLRQFSFSYLCSNVRGVWYSGVLHCSFDQNNCRWRCSLACYSLVNAC